MASRDLSIGAETESWTFLTALLSWTTGHWGKNKSLWRISRCPISHFRLGNLIWNALQTWAVSSSMTRLIDWKPSACATDSLRLCLMAIVPCIVTAMHLPPPSKFLSPEMYLSDSRELLLAIYAELQLCNGWGVSCNRYLFRSKLSHSLRASASDAESANNLWKPSSDWHNSVVVQSLNLLLRCSSEEETVTGTVNRWRIPRQHPSKATEMWLCIHLSVFWKLL